MKIYRVSRNMCICVHIVLWYRQATLIGYCNEISQLFSIDIFCLYGMYVTTTKEILMHHVSYLIEFAGPLFCILPAPQDLCVILLQRFGLGKLQMGIFCWCVTGSEMDEMILTLVSPGFHTIVICLAEKHILTIPRFASTLFSLSLNRDSFWACATRHGHSEPVYAHLHAVM